MNHGELIAELESNGFTCKEEPVNLRSDYLTGMYYKMIGPVDTHGRYYFIDKYRRMVIICGSMIYFQFYSNNAYQFCVGDLSNPKPDGHLHWKNIETRELLIHSITVNVNSN